MKDPLSYSFERNQYFNGKLLTAPDFKCEQQYFNDKRRAINKLLFGSGIVFGLQVVSSYDKKAISVDTGMAIDYSGREIVVDSIITQNISTISGFPESEYSGSLYLYIGYDEKEKDPSHSIDKSDKVIGYNRVEDSHKLFIKTEAPDPSSLGFSKLIEDTCMVYDDSQIRIWQTVPRYVNPGEVFEVVLKLEKGIQTSRVEFEYELEAGSFSPVGTDSLMMSFSEPDDSNKIYGEFKYRMKAPEVNATFKDYNAQLTIKAGSLKLKIGDKELSSGKCCSNSVKIISEPVKDRILGSYHDLTLAGYDDYTAEDGIYLAKICILPIASKLGTKYSIEKVANSPFRQYVYNTSLLYKLGLMENDLRKFEALEVALEAKKQEAEELPKNPLPAAEKPKSPVIIADVGPEEDTYPQQEATNDIMTGTVDIDLEPNVKAGRSYFSEEIEHGLGPGPVFISTGIEENDLTTLTDLTQNSEQIFCGAYEVFHKSQYGSLTPPASIGTVVYPKRGTFRVGISFHSSTRLFSVRVRWWALRRPAGAENANRVDVYLPDFIDLKAGDEYQFSPVVTGHLNKSVIWSIDKADGGTIDEDGLYKAPNKKGVYRITATSQADPERSATTHVIVG